MRIHHRIQRSLAITAMLLLGPSGCGEELLPETRMWIAGRGEPVTDPDYRLACSLNGVTDEQGVSIRHLLPENVETDVPVQILVETPCTSLTATMKHDVRWFDDIMRGVAQTTVVAPAGAACDLTVTVEIANDRHVCSSRDEKIDTDGASDPACARLADVCADALADDPERTPASE